jgi:predicted Holliday junction resolvase-like endonuclease
MKTNELNVIKILNSIKGASIKCPSCNEEVSPKSCNLFDSRHPYPSTIKRLLDRQNSAIIKDLKRHSKEEKDLIKRIANAKIKLKKLKEKKVKRPKTVKIITRSINIGQIAEKILPSNKKFDFNPSDCRVLLTPIDYISFNGFSDTGKVEKLSFIEVKSGNARLQSNQSEIKDILESAKNKIKVIKY